MAKKIQGEIINKYQVTVNSKNSQSYVLKVYNETGTTVINSGCAIQIKNFDSDSRKILDRKTSKTTKIKMFSTSKQGEGSFYVESDFKKKIYRPFQTA